MARILMLFYEPSPGGQATHVLSLVKGLDRDLCQLVVAYPQHHSAIAGTLASRGIRSLALPMRRLNNLRAAVTLGTLIKREHIDLLHVHGHEAGLWGRMAARVAGAPRVVYTPHTLHSGILGQRAYIQMERILAPLTDIWITVNGGDRERLVQWGIAPADRVVTIHNGVDCSPLPEGTAVATRRSLGIPQENPLVAWVGRLSVQKGPGYFLKAAALALKQYPQARFLVAGDGPLQGEMEALTRRLDIDQSVLFLGWRADAREVMAAADVVVLSSLWEGLPYVILEAMALGKPVVATNVGGNPELVANGKTGLLVPPQDPAALARAMVDIIGDPCTAQRMGQAGTERVRDLFSLEQMTQRTQKVYDSLLKSRSNSGSIERIDQ